MTDEEHLWAFLPLGYAATVAIELPILWFCLSPRHVPRTRLIVSFVLTAFTYPIVVVALPVLLWPMMSRVGYLAIAETFAPAAECLLFYLAYVRDLPRNPQATWRDFAAITAANLASFTVGELYWQLSLAS